MDVSKIFAFNSKSTNILKTKIRGGRHLFQLVVRVLLGVKAEPGLAATEGDVDAGALERHEGGQGFDFISIDVEGVADAAFARGPVVRVLGPVAGDHLVGAVVSQQGERHLQDVRARFDDSQNAKDLFFLLLIRGPHLGQILQEPVFGQQAGPVEVVLHHVEEGRVLGGGDVLQPFGYLPVPQEVAGGVQAGHGDGGFGPGAAEQGRHHHALPGGAPEAPLLEQKAGSHLQ